MQTTLFLWVLSLIGMLARAEGPLPSWAMHYPEVAGAIATAAHESPLPGADGERRMAAVLVAVAYHESRFDQHAKGDKGASLGAFQIGRTWGPPADTDGQARLAARLVLDSFRTCAARPLEERLGWYAWGRVGCEHALGKSRVRMNLAGRLLKVPTPALPSGKDEPARAPAPAEASTPAALPKAA